MQLSGGAGWNIFKLCKIDWIHKSTSYYHLFLQSACIAHLAFPLKLRAIIIIIINYLKCRSRLIYSIIMESWLNKLPNHPEHRGNGNGIQKVIRIPFIPADTKCGRCEKVVDAYGDYLMSMEKLRGKWKYWESTNRVDRTSSGPFVMILRQVLRFSLYELDSTYTKLWSPQFRTFSPSESRYNSMVCKAV